MRVLHNHTVKIYFSQLCKKLNNFRKKSMYKDIHQDNVKTEKKKKEDIPVYKLCSS